MMWLGIMMILSALLVFSGAERSRRDIEVCKNLFMSENGWSFSMFGYLYQGRPQIARNEIVQNRGLRRTFLIEQYSKSALLFIGGVIAFIYAF